MNPAERVLGKTLIVVPRDGGTGGWFHENALRRHLKDVSTLSFLPAIRERGIRGAEELLERTVAEQGIGTVMMTFWGDSFQFDVGSLRRLRERAALVIWAFDDECYFDAHGKYYAQAADAVVTTDYFSVPSYARLDIPAVLYFTSHSKDFFRPLDCPRDIDVSFVGDCTKCDRMELMRSLQREGLRVRMFGQGSEDGYVHKREIARVFSRTKVNLNFTKMEPPSWLRGEDPLLQRVRQNKGRPIEVALTRSFCLSEYAPSLPHLFKVGEEVGCFRDEAELIERVRYYLAHDEEREAVAERAYRRAMAEYEDDVCIPRVIEALARILEARRERPPRGPVLLSPLFRQRQVGSIFVHFASALTRGRLAIAAQTLPRLFRHGPGAFLKGFLAGARHGLGILCRQRLAGFYRPDTPVDYWR